ncbi:PEP-CTERM sorting domain-containing protein [Roseisolibacter sp. H3M3-2]|uniref:PEP-CTERM sorting domain-containing protein n=1 Tax=Roseisolibacter sp. H3M3-2 TaxID=3031323 RepID=UPI0023DA249E|nr:PEP-CTERM sorting domain-containing protein [Roseisolibacter sp. H3M3-2]MDF1503939.1 PEP-CTERM sorting domain-containing protein [Roseisolibacter sp. H3M3-2]
MSISLRSIRSVVGAALLAAAAALPAGAQAAISVQYEGGCGPSLCGAVQFNITNTGASTLLINTLSLTATSNAFAFSPEGSQLLGFDDDLGDPTFVEGFVSGGTNLFIDFLSTGLPFELASGSTGYVEVSLAQAPALTGGAFTFTGELPGDQSIRGTVSAASAAVVPEPSTYVLLATGLGVLGLAARRRRVHN